MKNSVHGGTSFAALIVSLLALSLLPVPSQAEPAFVVVQLGSEKIRLAKPSGFSDALAGNPTLRTAFERLYPSYVLPLAYFVADADFSAKDGGQAPKRTFAAIAHVSEEVRRLRPAQFEKLKQERRTQWERNAREARKAFKEQKPKIESTLSDATGRNYKVQTPSATMTGVIDESDSSISIASSVRQSMNRGGESVLVEYVSISTVALLRGQAVELNVQVRKDSPKDSEWAYAASRRWVRETLSLNAPGAKARTE